MPKTWQPDVDLKELDVKLPTPQPPASDVFLKSLLQRKYEKFPEAIKLQCEMHGVYSMPDLWRAKAVTVLFLTKFKRRMTLMKLRLLMKFVSTACISKEERSSRVS